MKVDADMYNKMMKGTTTVGIVCSDGVVLGADSRSTMDTFIASGEARKVFRIDGNLAMTIAGGVGDAQELIRIIRAQNEIYKMNEGRPLSPKSATSLLSIILQENKMMPFIVQLIVGGINGGDAQLYSLDPFGGFQEETRFTSTGSGSPTALGYIEESYRKGMPTKDGIRLAVRALTIAMKRDSATGGDKMIVAVITKSGYTEYGEKDLDKIVSGK